MSNQGGANLKIRGIFAGSTKNLDFLRGLEKQSNFPAVLVYLRDGCGPEVLMIGDQYDGLVLFQIIERNLPQRIRAVFPSFRAGRSYFLIRTDISAIREGIIAVHLKLAISLKANNKKDAIPSSLAEQGMIQISSVHDYDGT